MITTDFYEDDEPVEKVLAAFDAATEKGKTVAPRDLTKVLAVIDKIPNKRQREVVKREFYRVYKDDPRLWADGEGSVVEPRKLDTVISVRLPSDLAAQLRERANALGVNVSDLLRHAADEFIRPTGWRCQHVAITGRLESANCGYGCAMTPQFASH